MAHKDDIKAVEQYIQNDRKPIRHPGAFLDLLDSLTGKKKYEQIKDAIERKQDNGEEITMFCIEDEWERRGEQRGILNGMFHALDNYLARNPGVEVDSAASLLGFTEQEVETYMQRRGMCVAMK